jgi:hypothetical protein
MTEIRSETVNSRVIIFLWNRVILHFSVCVIQLLLDVLWLWRNMPLNQVYHTTVQTVFIRLFHSSNDHNNGGHFIVNSDVVK